MTEIDQELRVARTRECNAQLSDPDRAIGDATIAQLTWPKAASLRILERNRARNSCATASKKGAQLWHEKQGAKVARVARSAHDKSDPTEAIREHLDVRAAIMEHDGGLPRQEAERQARAACRMYEYRLTDSPSWLVLIAPGCDLAEANHELLDRFPGRLRDVREYFFRESTSGRTAARANTWRLQ